MLTLKGGAALSTTKAGSRRCQFRAGAEWKINSMGPDGQVRDQEVAGSILAAGYV